MEFDGHLLREAFGQAMKKGAAADVHHHAAVRAFHSVCQGARGDLFINKKHEVLRVADGGLIAATEMIFQSDESSGRVVQIDGVCRPCPAFLSHFLEVFIPKLIHEFQCDD